MWHLQAQILNPIEPAQLYHFVLRSDQFNRRQSAEQATGGPSF